MKDDLLYRIQFFKDLPAYEIETLKKMMPTTTLSAGEILFREGDPGDALFLVAEGTLDVLLGEGTDDEKIIDKRVAGEYMGEMGLVLPGGRRTASIRAATDSTLRVLTRADFEALLRRQPEFIFFIARTLSERLDASNTASYREILGKNRALQEAYDELKAAQEQIIAKEKLEKELQLAADIQVSILPHQTPVLPEFNFGVHMQPARAVGGDFYDLFQLDEHRIGVLIGDVADKGVPSALFSARVHALISAEAMHCDYPGDVLRRVNAYLFNRDEIDLFITVIYGILDCRNGRFEIARAGHEIPLLRQSGASVDPIASASGQPLGILDPLQLDEQTLHLHPGETLLLFSDGLTDCRNPQGKAFGYERLRESLAHCAAQSADETCQSLTHTLLAFRDGAEQDDDVTLVTIMRERIEP